MLAEAGWMPDRLDSAFAMTTKVLFGKGLSPMEKYEEWLRQRIPPGKNIKSCFGHGQAYVPQYGALKSLPASRVASEQDLEMAAGKKYAGTEYSLAGIAKALPYFAYFVPTYAQGRNIDVADSFLYLDCMGIRWCFDPFTSKNCAYVHSIMEAEGIFGMYRIDTGKFSIHCYNSINVQRCFEMDGVRNCSDCMFCHNAESLDNCMFCFNTKGKRYAIGNMEVGREEFTEFREKFLARIVPELENTGRLPFDIYDVLCQNKKSGVKKK